MTSIGFVGCVKQKCSQDAPAQDMYVSDLFAKSRAYVERHFDHWFILSAKYGLLEPKAVISPYDVTLNGMGIRERRQWADSVLKIILDRTNPTDTLTFLTGARYHEFLIEPLRECGYSVHLPAANLPIGKRLQWLKKELQA
jgi:hypothetical protein